MTLISPTAPHQLRIATFNVAFDRPSYRHLLQEMQLPVAKQNQLIDNYLSQKAQGFEKILATKVMQIRNVAAIIQRVRPQVLLLNEFNNEGKGKDNRALRGFLSNYLAQAQSSTGIGGALDLAPIDYPHLANFATNTGRASGIDLNHDGKLDPWSFGDYHGQYAFALLSQYPLGKQRTFQHFRWADLANASNVKINCEAKKNNKTQAPWCQFEYWYPESAWQQMPLSSKNHVDIELLLPAHACTPPQTIHLLLSHPTPPVFDQGKQAPYNKCRNAAEIQFWCDYLTSSAPAMIDDQQQAGKLGEQPFVILGDLNADPILGDGDRAQIQQLLLHPQINSHASVGSLTPQSAGALDALAKHNCRVLTKPNTPTQHQASLTSSFGLRADYVLPSKQLKVLQSGVFWPTHDEPQYRLIEDPRFHSTKTMTSSDHRLVWLDLRTQL